MHHGLYAVGAAQADVIALVRQAHALHVMALADRAQVDGAGIVRPDGPRVDAVPAELAVHRQLGLHLDIGGLGRGGTQQPLQLVYVICRDEMLRCFVCYLLRFGRMQVAHRPVGQGQHIGGGTVVILHGVGVVEEEIRLERGRRQCAADVVLLGQILAVQHFGRNLLCLGHEIAAVGTGLQLVAQILADLDQAFHQQRVKGAALAVHDHMQCGVVVKGLFIAALAGQCVVNVGQRHGLGTNGDVVALQPVGVAAAVVPLMVPAADLACDLDQRCVLLERQIMQDFVADGGVRFHDLELFPRELAGLVQNRLGNIDLADVMQRRCR